MKIIQNFKVFESLKDKIDERYHKYIVSILMIIHENYGEMEGDTPAIPKGDGGVVVLIENLNDLEEFKKETGTDLLSENCIFEAVQEFTKDGVIDGLLLVSNEFGYEIYFDISLKDELLKNPNVRESYVIDENIKGNFSEYSENGELIQYTTEEWYNHQLEKYKNSKF